MFGRTKDSVASPSVESLDADAAAVAETLEADRKRLAEIDEAFEASVDVDERERLRVEKVRVEARIDDARELHETLVGRRDRLARDRRLAALDPKRQRLVDVRASNAALRADLAAGEVEEAELLVELSDQEDAILHPTLMPHEEQEVRYLLREWQAGGPIGVQLGQASKRVQKAFREKAERIAAAVPAAIEARRRQARQSWKDAGVERWEPVEPIAVPQVEIPEPEQPPSLHRVG